MELNNQNVNVQVITEINATFNLIDANQYSRWTKLVRITVWVLKFIKFVTKDKLIWLQEISDNKGKITVNDIVYSRKILLKQAQSEGMNKGEIENGTFIIVTRIYGGQKVDLKIPILMKVLNIQFIFQNTTE